MTIYTALFADRTWEKYTLEAEPNYTEYTFTGAEGIPIHGIYAFPKNSRGTIVATYGITGNLDNQWFLRILGRKAYTQGYGVVLFDWRGHGKTSQLSPNLTSDGIYEGIDFVMIAQESVKLGAKAPFWFSGYSLGGQLALWGVKAAQGWDEFKGGAVICPSLESERSLLYLMNHPIGKHLEKSIAKGLKRLATELYEYHPEHIDPRAIDRANTIWGFDQELVIPRLGFETVSAYYQATSPIYFIEELTKPTLIIYAEDDPLFIPELVDELVEISYHNSALDLILTKYGGHVGYISSRECQKLNGDCDPWWAWNRLLEWMVNS